MSRLKATTRIHAMVVMGTRPEALKLAPVVRELQQHGDKFQLTVVATAQHRDLLDQVVRLYRIPVDYDLNMMLANQKLDETAARVLVRISGVLRRVHPDVIIVQGDTTTTFVASLAGFYQKIPVAHVEAGLRTLNRFAPFPEEINRRLTTHVADFHYAPTNWARENLMREGVSEHAIEVTGNTIVDTFLEAEKLVRRQPPSIPELDGFCTGDRKLVVVTAHRRESFGAGIENICRALKAVVDQHKEVRVIYPVHPNPNVRGPVFRLLGKMERIKLIKPLEYLPFVWLLTKAYLVLTDSGGIQEEVPSLGRPVLVMRDTTERPEGVEAGVCRLVGTRVTAIVGEVNRLLEDASAYRQFGALKNPFGDGKASARIVESLSRRLPLPQLSTANAERRAIGAGNST